MTRATRADEIRTERRRKPGNVLQTGKKLAVNEAALDRDNFEYRFFNDTPGRIQAAYDNDWDTVTDPTVKPDADGAGTVIEKVVGTDGSKPTKGVLMKKRRDWYQQDQKEKRAHLDKIEESIRRGAAHRNEADLAGAVSYTPEGGNTLRR